MTTKALGWTPPSVTAQLRALRRSHPEAGDSLLAGIVAAPTSDLLPYACELNQLNLGACTAHGIAQAIWIAEGVAGFVPDVLARLWLYYQERAIEGTIAHDDGANIGDGFAMLAAKGIPTEECYPYDVTRFAQDPGPAVDRKAFDSRGAIGINYHPISTKGQTLLDDVERALTGHFAVVFGCQVSEAFCSETPTGTVQAPGPDDIIAGGHCLTVIGHDHRLRRFKVKNSWGDEWGDSSAGPGCFWMSYGYFADSMYGASDIWIVLAIPQGVEQ